MGSRGIKAVLLFQGGAEESLPRTYGLFTASFAHVLHAGYLEICMSLGPGFFLFVGLAFLFLLLRSVRCGASYGHCMADVICERHVGIVVEFPMLAVLGHEIKAL